MFFFLTCLILCIAGCGAHIECNTTVEAPFGHFGSQEIDEDYYHPDEFCTWLFTVSNDSLVVLRLFDFDLEDSGEFCVNDSLTVYDGHNASFPVITKLCGSPDDVDDMEIVTTGSQMYVEFVSDSMIEDEGFFGLFWSRTDCNIVYLDVVIILDSSYNLGDEHYFQLLKNETKDHLAYLFLDEGNVRVGLVTTSHPPEIQFYLDQYMTQEELFDAITHVPYGDNHNNISGAIQIAREEMFAEAYGGRSDVDDVIIMYIFGVEEPEEGVALEVNASIDAGIRVRYIGLDEYPGPVSLPPPLNYFEVHAPFDLQYLLDEEEFYLCYPVPSCGANFTRDWGKFHTPYFPNADMDYPENSVCEWSITVSNDSNVVLGFYHFELQEGTGDSCEFDNFTIYDGPDDFAPELATLCGFLPNDTTIKGTSNQMFLKFQSDSSIQFHGIDGCFWAQIDCDVYYLDIVYIFDNSYNVWNETFLDFLKFSVKEHLDHLFINEGNVRVGLITYSDPPEIVYNLSDHQSRSDVHAAIDSIQLGGGDGYTNITGALRLMREVMFNGSGGDRPGVANMGVLMVTGFPDDCFCTLGEEAWITRSAGIRLRYISPGPLPEIPSHPYFLNEFLLYDLYEMPLLVEREQFLLCNLVTPTYFTNVTAFTSDATPYAGTNVTLTCQVERSPFYPDEPVTYEWVGEDGNGVLFFSQNENVTFFVDTGLELSLRCRATIHEVNMTSSEVVNVTAQDQPPPSVIYTRETPFVGNNYVFLCSSPVVDGLFDSSLWRINGMEEDTSSVEYLLLAGNVVYEISCAVRAMMVISPFSNNVTFDNTFRATINVPNLTPYAGTNLTLTCDADLPPGHTEDNVTFSWFQDDVQTLDSDTLTIFITTGLEQSIFCLLDTGWGNVTSQTVNITATDQPPPVMTLARQNPFIGNNYLFTCTSPVVDGLFDGSLWRINGVEENSPSGQYLLLAGNDVYEVSCAVLARMVISPFSNNITLDNTFTATITVPTLTPYAGTNLTLTCDVVLPPGHSEDNVTLSWFQDNVRTLDSDTLTIFITTGLESSIVCLLDTGWGNVTSQAVNVTATEQPPPVLTMTRQSPFAGNNYLFTCASPLVDLLFDAFIWRINGVEEENPTNQYLLLAGNDVYQISCAARVRTVTSPFSNNITLDNTFTTSINVLTLTPYAGTNLALTCDADLPPGHTEDNVTFSWFQDDVQTSDSDTLTIFITTGLELSIFCLVDTGWANVTSQTVNITATDQPPPVLTMTRQSPFVGNNYLLTCTSPVVDGLFDVFLWRINGVEEERSPGHYLLLAINAAYEISCAVQALTVTSPFSNNITLDNTFTATTNVSNLTPYAGTNLTLTCDVVLPPGHSEDNVTFSWFQNDVQTLGSDTLTIFITTGLEQSIFCLLDTGWANVTSQTVDITATDQPPPVLTMTRQSPFVGNNYLLTCTSPVVDGLFDVFLWRINGVDEESPTNQYLLLAGNDVYQIFCAARARTVTSPFSNNITLDNTFTASINVSTLTPYAGTNLTLTCDVDLPPGHTEDNVTLSWFQDDVQTSDSDTLTMFITTELEQSIFCLLDTGWGNVTSQTVIITATEQPPTTMAITRQSPFVGNNYLLTCASPVVDGLFDSYLWRINDVEEESPSGQYVLLAANDVYQISCAAKARTVTSPFSSNFTLDNSFTASIIVSTLTPYAGTNLTLTCDVDLPPGHTEDNVTLSWFQDDVQTLDSDNLTIFITTELELSIFCLLDTGWGNVTSQTVNITATEQPPPATTATRQSPFVGNNYLLTCSSPVVDGLFDGSLWRINGVEEESPSGQYLLLAGNDVYQISCAVVARTVTSPFSSNFTLDSSINVSIEASSLTPFAGTNVNLTCPTQLPGGLTEDNVTFSWVDDDGDILFTDQNVTFFVTSGMELQIRCEVDAGWANATSQSVTVTAQVQPSPTVTHVRQTPFVGNNYVLTCGSPVVGGLFTGSLWRINDVIDSSPTLEYVFLFDADVYDISCAAQASSVTSPYSDVITFDHSAEVSIDAPTLTPYAGTHLTLTCHVNVSLDLDFSNETFYWIQSGRVTFDSQTVTIFIPSGVEFSVHCLVDIGRISVTSELVIVTAQDPPPAVVSLDFWYDNVYALICESAVDGFALDSTQWRIDGVRLNTSTPRYFLSFNLNVFYNVSCAVHALSVTSPYSEPIVLYTAAPWHTISTALIMMSVFLATAIPAL